MITEPGTDDDPAPEGEPGAPALRGPPAPDGGPSANGASGAARAEHAARAARAQAAAAARAQAGIAARTDSRATSRQAERAGAYAGLATRAIAYVIDASAINLVALVVGVAAALALSVFHLPHALDALVASVLAVAYILWAVGYFVVFWSTTGQTPGSRVMQIRVIDAKGAARLKPRRALVRVGGLVLATIPLFAGFIIMLWDRRRRCLQDRLARTLVVHVPPEVRKVTVAPTVVVAPTGFLPPTGVVASPGVMPPPGPPAP